MFGSGRVCSARSGALGLWRGSCRPLFSDNSFLGRLKGGELCPSCLGSWVQSSGLRSLRPCALLLTNCRDERGLKEGRYEATAFRPRSSPCPADHAGFGLGRSKSRSLVNKIFPMRRARMPPERNEEPWLLKLVKIVFCAAGSAAILWLAGVLR